MLTLLLLWFHVNKLCNSFHVWHRINGIFMHELRFTSKTFHVTIVCKYSCKPTIVWSLFRRRNDTEAKKKTQNAPLSANYVYSWRRFKTDDSSNQCFENSTKIVQFENYSICSKLGFEELQLICLEFKYFQTLWCSKISHA